MAFFVASKQLYDGVYPQFLDDTREDPFRNVGFESDPVSLDLRASEREALAKGNTAIGRGYRVESSENPVKVLYACGDSPIPDMIPAGPTLVSLRLRNLMESFEPRVHQFFPVEIYKSKVGAPVATYYWLNICNRIDSVNAEMTNYNWKWDYTGVHGFWSYLGVCEPKLVLSSLKIKPYCFWMDPQLPSSEQSFYCANTFANAALEQDFTGLNLFEREEA